MHDLFVIIIAGIWGTLLMTGAMYLLFLITRKNYKVVGILATMVTNHTTRDKGLTKSRSDLFIGVFLHYLIGIIFSFIYYFLCESAVMEPDIRSGMLFGMAAGIVAMIFWYCFIKMHPNPPLIPLYSYITAIWIGHVIFGMGQYMVFMQL